MTTTQTVKRPLCPMCRQTMIYTAIIVDGKTIWAWVCNCRNQPEHMLPDIENARLEPNASLVYQLEITNG